ncbi:hypothetical protein ANN_11176 [Periplaneta americana]|uniref:General transcription factor IIH subunit 3 n=1 Tax=Periplaneta americana TaxID=6978 RepID=A0ABQ8T5H3_PERAM|nr:hypothetical protein ANN_11176 [Periplaneta americana]
MEENVELLLLKCLLPYLYFHCWDYLTRDLIISLLVMKIDSNRVSIGSNIPCSILSKLLQRILIFISMIHMLNAQHPSIVLIDHCQDPVLQLSCVSSDVRILFILAKTLSTKVRHLLLNTLHKLSLYSTLNLVPSHSMVFQILLELELAAGNKMNSRILTVTGSADSASQYMNYMNVFFTAQKQNVTLDVCSLDQDLGLLQQGCDITGGLYLHIPQLQGLLQYLLWVFLPEPPIRKKLVLPPPVKVDYRAACFCHRELIDIGFVCSVCLSMIPTLLPCLRFFPEVLSLNHVKHLLQYGLNLPYSVKMPSKFLKRKTL